MLRQNRYKPENFITSKKDLAIIKNEITISEKHDIAVVLEPYQIEDLEELLDFIVEISKNVPTFDNEVQDYYEKICSDNDFPHLLSVIYINGAEIILDYWSEHINNQFTIIYSYEPTGWKLKRWNTREIS